MDIAAVRYFGVRGAADGAGRLNALLADDEAAFASLKTSAEWLDDIMAGKYPSKPVDTAEASAIASDLEGLCGIANGDIAAYASLHGLKMAQVRNVYYKALANALMAEIMINPTSEEKYQGIQTILMLFLEPETDADAAATKAAIREKMSPAYSQRLAERTNLPTSFVEFVIMDETWDDEEWENDDEWRRNVQWNAPQGESFDVITIGSRDGNGSTRIADMQEILISLGYLKGKADGVFGPRTQSALLEFQLANGLPATGVYGGADYSRLQSADAVARWEYDDDFWDSQDFDSYNSTNSPDTGDSPDSPEGNSPDTPRRSKESVKQDSLDSPDTPKQNKNASKKDSPDSPDTPRQSGSNKNSSGKSGNNKRSSGCNSSDSPDSRDSD